jgi:hypothetical protein
MSPLLDANGRTRCLICPGKDDEPVYHLDLPSNRSHILLSNIIAEGVLSDRWFTLTRQQQRVVLRASGVSEEGFIAKWAEAVQKDRKAAIRELVKGRSDWATVRRTLDPSPEVPA